MPLFNFSLGEMLIIGVVILVFVGPDRIPELMSTAGKYYGRFRRMSDDLRRAFNAEVARHEADRRRQELEARRKAAEEARQAEREAASATETEGAPAEAPMAPEEGAPAEAPVMRPLPGGAARRLHRTQPPPEPPPEPAAEPEDAS